MSEDLSTPPPTDWSKWAPAILTVVGWVFGAGIAWGALAEMRRDVAVIDATVKTHIAAEGHVQTMRRVDRLETEGDHTKRAVRELGLDLGDLETVLERVDRRTEALCAESPQCRRRQQ